MGDRFLADEIFPADLADWLRDQGHDVQHAAARYSGESDPTLLEIAQKDGRILLTLDRGFGDLVFRRRLRAVHGIVLFRIRSQPPGLFRSNIRSFFESEPKLAGHFTVVTPGRFRQTQL
jgi:predicted nuclease of predicted toxin-antitoxin system